MRLKAFLVLLFCGCAVSFAGYSLALPSLLSASPLLPSGGAIVVWCAAAGFFQGEPSLQFSLPMPSLPSERSCLLSARPA